MIHGIDLSRWQTGLKIADLPAGVGFVNISVSKGLSAPAEIGQKRQEWALDARKAGKALLAYHWLNNSASGADQWAACRRELIATFGGLSGFGLQLDCEDTASPASYQHVKDFLTLAQAELRRPVAFYTGDWWLAGRSTWPSVSALTPYLWATANDGWLSAVPGELSRYWRWTGVGGWSHLSLLQWSDTQKIKGISVSSTVIRNPEVLCALTGAHVDLL